MVTIVLCIAVFFMSAALHELGHAWMAERFGDPTPRAQGRITMNPLAHIHPIGTVLLPALCLLIGAPMFGWAKPVMVNFANLYPFRKGIFWVAIAGVIMNAIIALTAAFMLIAFSATLGVVMEKVLVFAVFLNLLLIVFNLIPIPPLDGSKILALVAPRKFNNFMNQYSQILFIMLIVFFPYLPFGKWVHALTYLLTGQFFTGF